jgi:hypothetical protein
MHPLKHPPVTFSFKELDRTRRVVLLLTRRARNRVQVAGKTTARAGVGDGRQTTQPATPARRGKSQRLDCSTTDLLPWP